MKKLLLVLVLLSGCLGDFDEEPDASVVEDGASEPACRSVSDEDWTALSRAIDGPHGDTWWDWAWDVQIVTLYEKQYMVCYLGPQRYPEQTQRLTCQAMPVGWMGTE
jgi:hypothetical protein